MSDDDLAWNRRGLIGPGQRRAVESHLASFGTSRYAKDPAIWGQAAGQLGDYVTRWEGDLEGGRVVAFDGALVFDFQSIRDDAHARTGGYYSPSLVNTAYVATMPGQAPARLAFWFELPPGPYRFYLAPRSGYVVAAEPMASPEVYRAALYDLLRRAQNVTEETLAANRSGRMTNEQRAALTSWRAEEHNLGPPLALLAAVFTSCLALDVVKKLVAGAPAAELVGKDVVFLVLVVGFTVSAILAYVSRRRKLAGAREDVREGRVVVVEGPCKKVSSVLRHGRVSKSLHVADHRFDVSHQGELFAALVDEQVYRAYIAPRSGRFLSIEPAQVHFSPRSG